MPYPDDMRAGAGPYVRARLSDADAAEWLAQHQASHAACVLLGLLDALGEADAPVGLRHWLGELSLRTAARATQIERDGQPY